VAMGATPVWPSNPQQSCDWGFAPMPFEGLTTEAQAGWAPGNDRVVPSLNASPVWITPLTATRV
jgi:hypothetical protein